MFDPYCDSSMQTYSDDDDSNNYYINVDDNGCDYDYNIMIIDKIIVNTALCYYLLHCYNHNYELTIKINHHCYLLLIYLLS